MCVFLHACRTRPFSSTVSFETKRQSYFAKYLIYGVVITASVAYKKKRKGRSAFREIDTVVRKDRGSSSGEKSLVSFSDSSFFRRCGGCRRRRRRRRYCCCCCWCCCCLQYPRALFTATAVRVNIVVHNFLCIARVRRKKEQGEAREWTRILRSTKDT